MTWYEVKKIVEDSHVTRMASSRDDVTDFDYFFLVLCWFIKIKDNNIMYLKKRNCYKINK